MKTCIVVPTIREECIKDFLTEWRDEFKNSMLIVVEDNPEKTFNIKAGNVKHFSWKDIDEKLGSNSWIIPRCTDCVRSFGYYLAYLDKPDMIITLDDDCYPDPEFPNLLESHWERLNKSSDESWVSTIDGVIPRGVPYFETERHNKVILNHGLWNNVIDFDAPTQLIQQRQPETIIYKNQTIPLGKYFPMCGMNLAWRPEATPALYFLLMGRNYDFDRFGDIWSGVIFKKISDHLGWAINSGDPKIFHKRASNVFANLKKEAPGLEVNEKFWNSVDSVLLTKTSFQECYIEIAEKINLNGDYWDKLKMAMKIWASLFE